MTRKPVQIMEKPPAARGTKSPRQARPAPAVTAAWLERVALHYLDRYSASAEMLRRVLTRRVDKRARARGEVPEAHADLIEVTLARALRAGLVDDRRFASARLATLRRRGSSARQAQATLRAKGVARETVVAVLAQEDRDTPADAEAAAAEAYARRRRLGPYRAPDLREAYRERDLAAMARAGFSYGLARDLIARVSPDPDENAPDDAC